ncbi:hypothetical protein BHE74_00004223 [Ensete ventricosum]|nr:hypothetical protein BHE74_00004223 [Ensete ventricosum]RZS23079.1 hypothetical protein BHM03_00055938 [Ensete ventricosum]
MHRAGVRTIRLGTHQECVGSSQKVSGVCQDDAREFAKRRPRLARRLSWVAEKLTGISDGFGERRLDRPYPGNRVTANG